MLRPVIKPMYAGFVWDWAADLSVYANGDWLIALGPFRVAYFKEPISNE